MLRSSEIDPRCQKVVAASAVLLARTRAQRALLLALWGGYFSLVSLIDNYVSTHDYYSLPSFRSPVCPWQW